MPLTQHQMQNIAAGVEPDAPRWYRADLVLDEVITPFKVSCRAKSYEEALAVLHSATFYANGEVPLRTIPFSVRNLRLQGI